MKIKIIKFRYYLISIPKRVHNYFFCLKYPFYKTRNVWTDEFVGYSSTWYDEIPEGWRKAFGNQLSKELRKQLKKDKQLKTFRFTQIKEKYGTLRLYNNGCSEETYNILHKYEVLSAHTCIECGKEAKYICKGYILPFCEECFNMYPLTNIKEDKKEEYKKLCKIKKEG